MRARTLTLLLLCTALSVSAGSRPSAPATPRETPFTGLGLPAAVETALTRGRFTGTPLGFRVIALSHAADGCAAQVPGHPERAAAARACVEAALRQARAVAKQHSAAPLTDAVATSGHGLFLAHLGLILGDGDATGECLDAPLHHAVLQRLAQLSLADAHGVAPSYEGQPFRWPADQSVVLAALARGDAAHGGALLPAPLAAFRRGLETATLHAATGLPPSELTGRAKHAALPRGCAQSFISRYLAEADAPLSATWWAHYRRHFGVRRGPWPGFREWPPGVDAPADVDSGPILLGVGAAASALGIAAARAQGDEALARELESAADLVGQSPLTPRGVASSTLAQAIRFQARWQPRRVAEASPSTR